MTPANNGIPFEDDNPFTHALQWVMSGNFLYRVPAEYRTPEVCRAAVKQDPLALYYVSDALMADAEFRRFALDELKARSLKLRNKIRENTADSRKIEEQWETPTSERKKALWEKYDLDFDMGKDLVLGLINEQSECFLEPDLMGMVETMEELEPGSVEKFRKEQGIYDEKTWF